MPERPTPRDFVRLTDGYHSPQLDVDIRLNTNESPEPPPPQFTAAVVDAVRRVDWHRYPERGAGELRTAIGRVHGVGPGRVFAANGSNEVIQTVLLAYGGPGRSTAVFEPTYALHSHLSRICGSTVLSGERTDDFAIDLDEVERLLTASRPSITFLCSPNNPTGLLDSPDDIRAVLGLVAETGGLLLVDEAYGQFADFSATELMGPEVPLVVSRTYSKTWAMAGARLGFLLAPEWVVNELDKVVLPYHLDAVKQIAGMFALEYVDAMNDRVGRLIAERTRLAAALAEQPVDVWPSSANFVLFRPRRHDGDPAGDTIGDPARGTIGDPARDTAGETSGETFGDRVWQALVDRSVLVRNCSSWRGLEGCLRVTIGTPDENDRFLAALTEVLP